MNSSFSGLLAPNQAVMNSESGFGASVNFPISVASQPPFCAGTDAEPLEATKTIFFTRSGKSSANFCATKLPSE
ncbi:hypothetical protein D3C76_1742350 [compost metagenome]